MTRTFCYGAVFFLLLGVAFALIIDGRFRDCVRTLHFDPYIPEEEVVGECASNMGVFSPLYR